MPQNCIKATPVDIPTAMECNVGLLDRELTVTNPDRIYSHKAVGTAIASSPGRLGRGGGGKTAWGRG